MYRGSWLTSYISPPHSLGDAEQWAHGSLQVAGNSVCGVWRGQPARPPHRSIPHTRLITTCLRKPSQNNLFVYTQHVERCKEVCWRLSPHDVPETFTNPGLYGGTCLRYVRQHVPEAQPARRSRVLHQPRFVRQHVPEVCTAARLRSTAPG